MDPKTTSRRTFLSLAMGAPIAGALAACGSSGPSAGPSPSAGASGAAGAASYWFLSGKPQEEVRLSAVERFNKANPGSKPMDYPGRENWGELPRKFKVGKLKIQS